MRKILITGGAGFIGSHLSELCIQLGYEVRVLIHYNSRNSLGWLENSEKRESLEFIAGDIRDYEVVHAAMKGCDTVLHLAALIGIPYSYSSPLAYVRVNVEGTYNVLEAARQLTIPRVVITSTSETYGTAQYTPIDEKHPVNAQSPYAASKVAADQLALSYYRSFGVSVRIARPFNTFGPRQSCRAIIPTIVSQLLNGQAEIRLGNVNPTRDFTFVKDTVRAIVEIAKSESAIGEVVNIGTQSEISIKNLVSQIAQIMDLKVKIVSDEQRIRPNQSEVMRLVCDHEKIKKITNWQPQFDLKTGLSKTIQWFRENWKTRKTTIYNV